MYIESLTVNQFRCFAQADMRFQYPGKRHGSNKAPRLANVNLLLGDNGTGKSAVLKAIALAVLAPILPSAGFRPYLLVRRTAEQEDTLQARNALVEAQIGLHEQDVTPVESEWNAVAPLGKIVGQAVIGRVRATEFVSAGNPESGAGSEQALTTELMDVRFIPKRAWEGIYEDETPAFFLIGYGATRRVESGETFDSSARERARSPRYQRVASLFEDYVTLAPVTLWLNELRSRSRLSEVVELFNQILPQDVKIDPESSPANTSSIYAGIDEAIFSVRGVPLPYAGLSDGYRSFIGWLGDLLYQMSRVTPENHKITDLRGVVMVDELDLLLHPSWQRTVVETLATAFPYIQFFFTSHSPIITATLEAPNLLLTESDPETGAITVQPGQERVYGLSADQVLTSSYFGLSTPRAPGAEREMKSIARRAWEGDENASLEFLQSLTAGFESKAPAPSSKRNANKKG